MQRPWHAEADSRALAVARVRAAFIAVTNAWYGLELGDAGLVRAGLVGMRYVLAD